MNIEKINGEKIQIARYRYEGLWVIKPHPSADLLDKLNALADTEGGWQVSFFVHYARVEYDGEDRKRWTLEFLKKAAPLIGNTKGEIVCFLFPHEVGTHRVFVEFLSVKNGKLRRQRAEVKRRGKSKVVTQKMLNAVKCLR